MGCTASRLDNEDLVRLCKERCRLASEALRTRHGLAAAVADYCNSLKITGFSFIFFAAGENFSVSDQTPTVLLPTTTTTSGEPPSYHTSAPPTPTPARVSEYPFVEDPKLPPSTSRKRHGQRRRKGTKKVPHILSESDDNSHTSKTSSTGSDTDWARIAPPLPDVCFTHRACEEKIEDKENHDPIIQTHYHQIQQQQEDCQHHDDDDDDDDDDDEDYGSSVHYESAPPSPSALKPKLSLAEESEIVGPSTATGQHGIMEIRHRDLKEIVSFVKKYFDKAADAGEHVSEMLETGPAQLDRSRRQLKSKYTKGLMSHLSSNRFEPCSTCEPAGLRSISSTLEQLFSLERKLYKKVKARQAYKIKLEKKLSALEGLESQGGDATNLNKTKGSIEKLGSLMENNSQDALETSTAIVRLLDAELVSQLIELCHGFMCMWRSMNQCHEVQNQVVQQVLGLINHSTKGESTSDLHHQATRDLQEALSDWNDSFCRLIHFQRDFILCLHDWFTLSRMPTGTEEAHINGSQPSNINRVIFYDWKLALGCLPDTITSKPIESFMNVVKSIFLEQAREMELKKNVESASKGLDKKRSSLRSIEKKYNRSYSMVRHPGIGLDNGRGLDASNVLSKKQSELLECQKQVEDELVRHSKEVEKTRARILSGIQTGVPQLFQAMTNFSGSIMEALEDVWNKSSATI